MTRANRIFAALGIFCGLILVQACSRPLESQESCNFVQNSQGQRVSWGLNVPIDIYLDQSVPQQYELAIIESLKIWNERQKRQLFRYRGYTGAGSQTPAKDGISKIYFMNEWEENRANEQARTTVFWTGARIHEADIRINAKNFTYFTTAEPTMSSGVHFESLMIHELGHVLGLAHNEAPSSVMHASLSFGLIRADLTEPDLNSVACEYK
jgi:hypothetical protein